jgi:DNA helicase-2/ATP-dependent DNA helicase PcrA
MRQERLGLEAGRFLGRERTGFTPFSPLPKPGPATAKPSRPSISRFQTGDEVKHEVFGLGVVIESRPAGDDEQVTVAFAGIGLKRLMASLAPMEKVVKAG